MTQLRLVHSKNEINSKLNSVRCAPSPASYSRSPAMTPLLRKVSLLQELRPAAAAVVEQLVDDCLARIDAQTP